MADALVSEGQYLSREPKRVKHISRVPLRRNHIFLSAGQAVTLKEEYPPLFESEITKQYLVDGVYKENGEKDHPTEVAIVDLKKMREGLLPYSDSFMQVFMSTVDEQLKTDLISTQAAKLLVDAKMAENFRFVRARLTLFHNSKTVLDFLENLGPLAEQKAVQKFREGILKTIQAAHDTFGKGKEFGLGSPGWEYKRQQ